MLPTFSELTTLEAGQDCPQIPTAKLAKCPVCNLVGVSLGPVWAHSVRVWASGSVDTEAGRYCKAPATPAKVG